MIHYIYFLLCIIVLIGSFWYIYNIKISKRGTTTVDIIKQEFEEKELTVGINTVLIIVNKDDTRNAIACSDPHIPNSDVLEKDEKYMSLLSSEGRYVFRSTLFNHKEPLTVNVI